MKYRILFAGNDEITITELFETLSESYELMTTSTRYRDIDSHLLIFKPNLYVFCLKDGTAEDIKHIAELRSYLVSSGAHIVIIGTVDECEKFQKLTMNMADFTIVTPVTAFEIASQLEGYAEKLKESTTVEKRKHVLVIDDDPQMLRLIKEMIHDNYDVATAPSGKTAYKFLEKKTTDIILLDFEMPEENGPQVLVKIRENVNLVDIPVLFLTGNTERDKIKEAMNLNPQGYLTKPIDRDTLVDSIKRIIG